MARRKMLRALVEFRIRGVKVLQSLFIFFPHPNRPDQINIPFLFRLLTHDVFIGGKTWTTVSLAPCHICVDSLT
jgi:pyruvate carboxylase